MTSSLHRCSWSTTLNHSNGTKWLSIIQTYIQERLYNARYHLLPAFHSSEVLDRKWCLAAHNWVKAQWNVLILTNSSADGERDANISVTGVLAVLFSPLKSFPFALIGTQAHPERRSFDSFCSARRGDCALYLHTCRHLHLHVTSAQGIMITISKHELDLEGQMYR